MSDQFIVSALKYRPQLFDTVVGQQHITTTLKNAIKSGQVAHSFLFCGPRGVGKTTCARILAKTLNCTSLTAEGEACNTCTNCSTFNSNTSFNVHELDAASNNSVEDIRTLIEQVRFAPSEGSKYKVYIIDEVHMLTTNAFNAFLKTLEEPPHYAVFILATTEKHKILPTILSRCQIFDFKRITNADVVQHLQGICTKENIPAEEDALHFIALKSEGCMRDALSIMDKITSFGGGKITYEGTIDNLNILDYEYFFKFTDHILLQDTKAAMLMLDEVLAKGFEGDSILLGLAEHMRNLMVCRDEEMRVLLEVTETIKDRYKEQSVRISNNLVLNAVSILSAADAEYKMARNKRLHVELCFIKLCNISRALELITQADGTVVKKNLLSHRIVPLHTVSTPPAAASLSVDSSLAVPAPLPQQAPIAATPVAATPVIQQELTAPPPAPIVSAKPKVVAPGGLRKLMQAAVKQASEEVQAQRIEITTEALEKVWQQVIIELSAGNDFFVKALQKCNITYTELCVSIFVENSMALSILEGKQLLIKRLLKDTFNNEEISLDIVPIQKSLDDEPKVRSQKEILEEMLAANEGLRLLKSELGLELDF
ncbi:MAG: hypothetical protein RL660_282 [Bacteroidota bacterium]|jgi:DNA polymerase-3 subunit gamma/tau